MWQDKSFLQTSVPTMSDVLPTDRMYGLVCCTLAVSESLWLSDSCLVVTGRRLMTAGRSRGGSMSVVMPFVMLRSDCRAAGLSESLLSADGWRRFTTSRFRGVDVLALRFGINSISLTTRTASENNAICFSCLNVLLQRKFHSPDFND